MKRAAVLLFVAALVLAGITPADAAIRKWSVEPAIHGGFVQTDSDLKADDTTFTGATLGLSVMPSFQVEVTSTTFSTESPSLGQSGNEYKQEMIGLRLVGTFLADQDVRSAPYIAAGGGKIKSTADPGGNKSTFEEEASYAEIAFGARIFVWKGFNVRPELGLQHARTIDIIGRDRTHTNYHFTVGLSWLLFGSK